MSDSKQPASAPKGTFARRTFLVGSAAAIGAVGAKMLYNHQEAFWQEQVVIAKADSYSAPLEDVIRRGLTELGFGRATVKGKSVLLKPNLVEPSLEAPHINTHPLVVRAAAEVFRTWDAREVLIAEGQGHCRDTYLVLEQSGLQDILDQESLSFIDLNHDSIFDVENRLNLTKLKKLHLPQTLRRADIIVSMPKLKTHHWAGVTLSMKNLFGIMPGICYGWPKNVLHIQGIEQSILDINASVRTHLAIVDGIIGMDGDGPIMGDAKPAGVLVMGRNFPAVDATATRIMKLSPERIPYIAYASGRLGPIAEHNIEQLGEPIAAVAQQFRLVDHPSMDRFRS